MEGIEKTSKPFGTLSLEDGIESSTSSPSELGMMFKSRVRLGLGFSFFNWEGGLCMFWGRLEGPGAFRFGELLWDGDTLLFRFRVVDLSDSCSWIDLYSSSRLMSFRINGLVGLKISTKKDNVEGPTNLATFQEEITLSKAGFGRICASSVAFRHEGHSCLLDRDVLIHWTRKVFWGWDTAWRRYRQTSYRWTEAVTTSYSHWRIV